jgi:hypothetical protein
MAADEVISLVDNRNDFFDDFFSFNDDIILPDKPLDKKADSHQVSML